MPLAPGRRLGPYEIVAAVGAGGMGEVYRAVDTRLGRAVALKVLAGTETSAEGRRRLTREARAVAALNHPHICTLHDIGTEDDIDYIVMELLEGETLRARLAGAGVPDGDVLRIAVELAGALAAAHRAGLTHGDLKPGNVMLTRDGAKLLDFGLSRRVAAAAGDATRTAQGTLTFGLAGTPGYMAPEQFQGTPAGMRTDVWALGTVIAEMLGTRTGPPGLQAIVERARASDPAARYPSAAEMLDDLLACVREFDDRQSGSLRSQIGRRLRQPAGQLILVAVIAVVALTVTWLVQRNARIAEARRQLTELARLADAEEYGAAFALARRLEQVIPHDPTLNAAWSSISETGEVVSDPPGARVSFKPYRDTRGEWVALGSTPVKNARLPLGLLRVRAEKPGYDTLTIARTASALLRGVEQRLQVIPRGLQLTRTGEESGMVRIGGTGRYAPFLFHGLPSIPEIDLQEYYLDRREVTNREFKAFVDAGGYVRPEYWRHSFVRNGKLLSWQDAVRLFVDRTGRPGPSTWELGDYPPGQGDLPVSGVSWFEAAAYAAHVRKELPTMYHWIRAASPELAHEILPLSNVPGPQQVSAGPARVASFEGISLYGASDVAGNVKEWCLNEAEPGRRLALGGAWDEPEYMFHTRDSRDAFDRSPNLGFRCARYARERLPREALAAVPEPPRTYDDLAPAADETFDVYRGIYAYDAAPLDARVDATEEDPGGAWRLERVSYVGPDGTERLPAYLFLPNESKPPYQAVVFFPGSSATTVRSSRDAVPGPAVTFLVKSGRAVLYPIYKGTYERGTAASPLEHRPAMAASFRDLHVTLSKEVRRGVDYLQSRPDIDAGRIGYFGLSWGACIAPLSLSLDTRMRAAVLVSGGLLWSRVRPEVDTIHFLPRVTAAVLMLNGERDAFYPPRSQRAMFDLLGAPPGRKRLVVFPGAGHAVPRTPFIAETLAWFDQHLGATGRATR